MAVQRHRPEPPETPARQDVASVATQAVEMQNKLKEEMEQLVQEWKRFQEQKAALEEEKRLFYEAKVQSPESENVSEGHEEEEEEGEEEEPNSVEAFSVEVLAPAEDGNNVLFLFAENTSPTPQQVLLETQKLSEEKPKWLFGFRILNSAITTKKTLTESQELAGVVAPLTGFQKPLLDFMGKSGWNQRVLVVWENEVKHNVPVVLEVKAKDDVQVAPLTVTKLEGFEDLKMTAKELETFQQAVVGGLTNLEKYRSLPKEEKEVTATEQTKPSS
eukprot:Platyproteum_vivax@DN6337_c0_g1_i1.p1